VLNVAVCGCRRPRCVPGARWAAARLGLVAGQVLLAVHQLLLERGKEALTTRSRVPGALSQQLPFLLMLQAMPCSSSFS
jgi:hypothetical protein